MDSMENVRPLSTNSLRSIATACMLVDHTAALIPRIKDIGVIYWLCRCVGRIAFPIFAFLLCEGFLHTKNIKKYGARLLAFAVISEIPFDLAVKGRLIDWSYQNVLITLFISLLMLCVISRIKNIVGICIAIVIATALCCLMRTDYAILGPPLVAALYLFRDKTPYQYLAAGIVIVVLGTGITKIFGLVPIALIAVSFNEQLGRHNKYIGYIFYPAHLLLIGIINTVMV